MGCQLDSAATSAMSIVFDANCSLFMCCNNILIITNTTPGNSTTGIYCAGANLGVITGNIINGSNTIGGVGIYLETGTYGTCTGNLTYQIPGSGIYDKSSGGWEVAHNKDV